MKKLLILLLLMFLTLPFMPKANATDYYVDSSAQNDSGDGSQNSPWKTIKHALQNASAPATINVAAGTYDTTNGETFPLNMKNNVSLKGADRNTTIIDAKQTPKRNAISFVSLGAGESIEKFTIKNGYTTGSARDA